MNEEILTNYRIEAEIHEEQSLHPKAAFSKLHSRRQGPEEDHRLPYRLDTDRIIHSKAYARYADKTQVVYLVKNDHITHRNRHVQLVNNFAKGIAEILRLNLDLIEAISLGHDVGHPPFGHEGEGYLSTLSIEYGQGAFAHPWQSCRLFSAIEPLNLGLAVYDGFLCHDGGLNGPKLQPRYNKTWEDHKRELSSKIANPDENIWPGTLEGCLVKLCDTICYLSHDIEDAVNLGILSPKDIPNTILGKTNRDILNTFARDIIKMSHMEDFIAISDEVYEALKALRAFNFERIYSHPQLKVESAKIERSYRLLFEILYEDHTRQQESSYLWQQFVHNKSEAYKQETAPARMVIDYISGMTDNFFVRTIEKWVVPATIEIRHV
jgi:dGTPase